MQGAGGGGPERQREGEARRQQVTAFGRAGGLGGCGRWSAGVGPEGRSGERRGAVIFPRCTCSRREEGQNFRLFA